MSTSAAKGSSIRSSKSKRISWEAFQKKYLSREDGYKYKMQDYRAAEVKVVWHILPNHE